MSEQNPFSATTPETVRRSAMGLPTLDGDTVAVVDAINTPVTVSAEVQRTFHPDRLLITVSVIPTPPP